LGHDPVPSLAAAAAGVPCDVVQVEHAHPVSHLRAFVSGASLHPPETRAISIRPLAPSRAWP
jgi:hypothetical protein